MSDAETGYRGFVWHFMDQKTVHGYGPWVRAEDYHAIAAERADLAVQLLAAQARAAEALDAQKVAEAKLAKAVEALEWLDDELDNAEFPECGVVRKKLRSALAEIWGE